MTRQQLMAPAIALASKGFILTAGDVEITAYQYRPILNDSPNIAAIFLRMTNRLPSATA